MEPDVFTEIQQFLGFFFLLNTPKIVAILSLISIDLEKLIFDNFFVNNFIAFIKLSDLYGFSLCHSGHVQFYCMILMNTSFQIKAFSCILHLCRNFYHERLLNFVT